MNDTNISTFINSLYGHSSSITITSECQEVTVPSWLVAIKETKITIYK